MDSKTDYFGCFYRKWNFIAKDKKNTSLLATNDLAEEE